MPDVFFLGALTAGRELAEGLVVDTRSLSLNVDACADIVGVATAGCTFVAEMLGAAGELDTAGGG